MTDANVLINLMHVDRLPLCAQLPGLEFVVPDHVREEITDETQRSTLNRAVTEGIFQIESITEPQDIASFGGLTTQLGRGEAACLVLATRNGWTIASDEKGVFRRQALARTGEDRLIGPADVYLAAIRAGRLSIDQADKDKIVLEERRFRMPFASFREVLATADGQESGP